MAARLNKRCSENARSHIKTIQLSKRLQKHALGKLELNASQIKATEILLKKTLPDMRITELSGPDGGNIPTSVRVEYSSPVPREAEDTEPTE